MRIFTIIALIGFVVITLLFYFYGRCFSGAGVPGIIPFEFANVAEGKDILEKWEKKELINLARRMIWIDFAYAFFYVTIIITFSNRQVRKEPAIGLNTLLRANFFFAFLAGVFDFLENASLLYNTYYWKTCYFSPALFAWLKFILIGWTILVWLVSFIKSKVK